MWETAQSQSVLCWNSTHARQPASMWLGDSQCRCSYHCCNRPFSFRHSQSFRPRRWPSGYGVRHESGRSWVWIPLATGFFRGWVIPVIRNRYSSGYPARRLAIKGQCWDWLAQCQYLWLDEMESLICNFYLSVAARKIEQIRPWDTLLCCWDVKQPTNKLSPYC